MNAERKFDKVAIDLSKLGRVSVKIFDLLRRKTKNPIDAYLVLKWLCFVFEADFGVRLEPGEESKLKKMMIPESENYEG
jgi:hypothetical protein